MFEGIVGSSARIAREMVDEGGREARLAIAGAREIALEEKGQGTTEYAILVGVLVVIAIVAIIAFRGKVTELWNAIAEGINSL